MERQLMGEKLKRWLLVGKREGNTTPSPTWKFGIIQPDGTLIQEDFNFSPHTLSARKLGANLWEMEPQLSIRVDKMSKNEAPADESAPLEQLTTGLNLGKQVAASPKQDNPTLRKVEQAQQLLSSASYCSSMEMAPYIRPISPNSSLLSKGKSGEPSRSLKTSTELLKVLNRIWSLEEKHALDMSLVRTLRSELDQSRSRIQELLQEKTRDQDEIDNLNKKITEYKFALKLVQDKLENEQKSLNHSEKLHHKLATALREIDREKKARGLLEDLCDEFAKGVRDYEREIRFLKQICPDDHRVRADGHDRMILHVSEAWLDERAQIKNLAESHDVSDKESALDKMCSEIEAFLRMKQSGKITESKHSLELEGPVSAPWNRIEEEDSGSVGNRCARFCRGTSSKSRTGQHLCETSSNPRMPRKGDTMLRSLREDRTRRDHVTTSEDKNVRHEEGSFDPSRFTGLPSPAKKWTSDVAAVVDPEASESSSRWPKSVKPNTLRAKLMEARHEARKSTKTVT